jgi:hypothetical protein
MPIDDEGYEGAEPVTSSYIQGKSAPTTPSILSGSGHPRRSKQKKTAYAHESYFPPDSKHDGALTKAKSTGVIAPSSQSYLGLSESVTTPLQTRGPSKPLAQQDDDWFYRIGSAIASGSRENKGQSWLVSRDSSTSLVQTSEGEVYHRKEHLELQIAGSNHASRRASRAASRIGSAKPSRRGSRVGSRVEFANAIDSNLNVKTIEGYFDQMNIEPDFVEKEDQDALKDDAEVARLSRVPGFGIGGLVDRLVGWPLFNVEEPSDEEDETEEESAEQLKKRKLAQLKRRTEELEKAASSSASATHPEPVVQPPRQQTEGGWNDAAWLLSVASKVIL